MIKYKIKNSDAKVILSQGNFSIDNCDIIINWIDKNITGPASYKNLSSKAGDQLHYDLIGFKNSVNPTDAFTTHSGLLSATIIVNCVMPENPAMYNDCFFKIKETIKKYHELGNLSRFITTTIPDINYKQFVYFFNTYLKEYSFIKEFRIIVDNEKQYDNLNVELKKYLKVENDLLTRFIKLFDKKNEIT